MPNHLDEVTRKLAELEDTFLRMFRALLDTPLEKRHDLRAPIVAVMKQRKALYAQVG